MFKPKRATPDTPKLQLGLRYDANPVEIGWPYAPHALISGVTGAGKSSWVSMYIAMAAAYRNTAIVGADPKRVELGGWRPRLTALAVTPNDITQLLSDMQQFVNTRADFLDARGLRHWDTRYGPAVLFIVEELAVLASIDSRIIAQAVTNPDEGKKAFDAAKKIAALRIEMLANLSCLARFAGVTIICTTQYPLASIVPSDLRSNLTGRIGCRVSSKEQINVGLGAGMADHIKPQDIGVHEPGVAHILGFDGYPKPIKARAHYPNDNYIAARAKQTAHLRIKPEQLFNQPIHQPKAA